MADRRTFLTAVASGSVGLSLVTRDPAIAQLPPAPLVPGPTPPPSPIPTAKLPSFPSAMLAESYKVRFDPALTEADRNAIAFAIDANRIAAAALNPKRRRLANGVEPIVHFSVADGEA